MAELIRQRSAPATIFIGVLLILVGGSLFLDRLDLVSFRWSGVTWVFLSVLGGYLAADGFNRKRRGRLFWGSGLFFFALFVGLQKLGLIERESFYLFPALMIALGSSFLSLFVREPREVVLLVPAILFFGLGTGAILVWWDVLDWYDVRWGIRTYWPLAFVVWGAALLLRKRPAPQ